MAMHLQNFFRQTQGRDGTSHFVVTLSAPAFALAVAVVAVTLGWCFFMGFMVGRGQNPEKHLEEIAGMLQPAGQQAAQPGQRPDGEPAQGQDDPAGQDGQGDQNGQDGRNADAGQDGQAGQNVEEAGDAQRPQAQKPQPQGVPAQPPLKDAIKPKPQAQPQEKAEPGVPTFTYTYRLATVKSQEAAKSEQKRYARKGFSCVIRSLGTGFSLNLTVKGTEKDDQALRQRLKSAGLGAPMLLSKKKR